MHKPKCSCGKDIVAPGDHILKMFGKDQLYMEYTCKHCGCSYTISVTERGVDVINQREALV
jgi:predicted nucleic-acid-binding Zn-ribbon protein